MKQYAEADRAARDDLGKVDMTKPDPWSSGDGAALLKKHKLKVAKGGPVAP
jgi:hypothetical protein